MEQKVIKVLAILAVFIIMCGVGFTLIQTNKRPPEECIDCSVDTVNQTAPKPHTDNDTIYPGLNETHIIYIWQPNCEYCVKMESVINELAKVYNVTKINLIETPSTRQKYGVTGTPATIIEGPHHSPRVVHGYASYEEITEEIGAVLVP